MLTHPLLKKIIATTENCSCCNLCHWRHCFTLFLITFLLWFHWIIYIFTFRPFLMRFFLYLNYMYYLLQYCKSYVVHFATHCGLSASLATSISLSVYTFLYFLFTQLAKADERPLQSIYSRFLLTWEFFLATISPCCSGAVNLLFLWLGKATIAKNDITLTILTHSVGHSLGCIVRWLDFYPSSGLASHILYKILILRCQLAENILNFWMKTCIWK